MSIRTRVSSWLAAPRWSRRALALWIAGAVLATLAATVVAANFMTGEKHIDRQIPRLYGVDDPQFLRVMGALLGPPVVGGNHYRVLRNGDEIFPAMLAAVRSAKKSISFETYIYWSGDIGQAFAQALAERARAGVRIHVLLDWVGSARMDPALLGDMQRAGVLVRKFHPPHWSHLGRLNNRTHRKLLIVDGQIGYTGGVGIAPQWTGHAQDPDHWRDTHFEVAGPVVAQMQSVFLDNWLKVTGQVLHGTDYFPPLNPLTPPGTGLAQMFSSSVSGGSESMQLMYLLSITAAQHSILLANAYFVPDDRAVQALIDAVKRGVRVQVIVPGQHTDTETVRSASRARWGPLLRAGVEIHEFEPTMFHCKVMVVDELLVSAGSTNFDDRSFRLNDEANLNIYDAEFARQQVAIFHADLARSRRVTLEQWEQRPYRERLAEQAASLLGSQL